MTRVPEFRDVVSLIPGGLIQFMDFRLDANAVRRTALYFREQRRADRDATAEAVDLYVLEQTADGEVIDRQSGKPGAFDYSFSARHALEAFAGRWIPVPYLQVAGRRPDGQSRFADGPTDWARVRLAEIEPNDDGHTHHVTLAFDTAVAAAAATGTFAALSQENLDRGDQFRFAHLERDNGRFVNLPWVDAWLKAAVEDHRRERRHGGADAEARFCDHLALYLTFLQVISDARIFKTVKLAPIAGVAPIDVDLVLDFGNSRTCGIMIESRPGSGATLGDSYVLQLRDLSQPERWYQEPFESRVEFARADFQSQRSRLSGRAEAFVWPSIVRVGPEAARLSLDSVGALGSTGMSSPKRYLWDETPQIHQWHFNGFSVDRSEREPPAVAGKFVMHVNEAGTPLDLLKEAAGRRLPASARQTNFLATKARYTRSSLMMFVLSEILCQALVQMNAPGQRAERQPSDIPRRLRQVVLTLPPAMPVAEQKIVRRWAKWAVRLTWKTLGWSDFIEEKPTQRGRGAAVDYRSSPRVRAEWDEATCTQLVFLFNETNEKMQGDIRGLFRLYGRARGGADPALRVASIDIGGGTTDLIINTYRAEGDNAVLIKPSQEFREGFTKAGDDILREVIELLILRAIQDALRAAGVTDPKSVLTRLFGADWINQPGQKRHLRRQFATQIAVPAALDLLHEYEETDLKRGNRLYSKTLAEALGSRRPADAVIDYVERTAKEAGARDFRLMDVPIRVAADAVDNLVRADVGQVLGQLCEIVALSDCDLLLLTGRPSRLPGVSASVLAKLPVPPDRIIAMHEFRVGGWYPFKEPSGFIRDPKTTVVVGGILCALAEGHLEGFFLDTSVLRPRSTARFIGVMEQSNEIRQTKLLFDPVNVASPEEQERETTLDFLGPISFGFRQLDAERWIATPFYRLDFANADAREAMRPHLPAKVQLGYRFAQELDEDEVAPIDDKQRDEGEFWLEGIESRNGAPLPKSMLDLRLQTLRSGDGYWLDTGIFNIV